MLAYHWYEQEPLVLNVLSFLHPQYVYFNTVSAKGGKKNYQFSPLWKINKYWKELLFSERFCRLYYVNCLCSGIDNALPFTFEACSVYEATPQPRKHRNYEDSFFFDDFYSDDELDESENRIEYTDNHLVLTAADDSEEDSDYEETQDDQFIDFLKKNASQMALNQIAMRAIRRTHLRVYPKLNFKDNFFQLLCVLRGALVVYQGYNPRFNNRMEDLINSFKGYFPGGDLTNFNSLLNQSHLSPIQNCLTKARLISNIDRTLNYVPYYQRFEANQNFRKVNLRKMFVDPQNNIFGSIYGHVIIFKDDGNVMFYQDTGNILINGLMTVVNTEESPKLLHSKFIEQDKLTPDISVMIEDVFQTMSSDYEHSQRRKIANIQPPEKTAYIYYTNITKPKLIAENPDKSRKEVVSMVSKMWKALPEMEKNTYKQTLEKKKADYALATSATVHCIRGLHSNPPTLSEMKRMREFDARAFTVVSYAPPFKQARFSPPDFYL